jgi:dCMP deaminase
MNKDWIDYYLGIALAASKKSKDTTKVGAVIVGRDNRVVSLGFNGFPSRIQDYPEVLGNRDPEKGISKYAVILHAEANAILHAKTDLTGSTLFCTHPPCAECAKQIVAAGISNVYCFDNTTKMDLGGQVRDWLFAEAGVEMQVFPRTLGWRDTTFGPVVPWDPKAEQYGTVFVMVRRKSSMAPEPARYTLLTDAVWSAIPNYTMFDGTVADDVTHWRYIPE